MDQPDRIQPPAIVGGTSIQMGHSNSPYQSAPMIATVSPAVAVSSPTNAGVGVPAYISSSSSLPQPTAAAVTSFLG